MRIESRHDVNTTVGMLYYNRHVGGLQRADGELAEAMELPHFLDISVSSISWLGSAVDGSRPTFLTGLTVTKKGYSCFEEKPFTATKWSQEHTQK